MTVNKKLTGSLAALTANVIFGFSNFFSVKALGFAEPLVILSLRFTVAFAALCLMRVFGVIKLSYKGKKLTGLVLMCLAQPLCYFLSELYGIDMTSSSFSGVMISLAPVAAVILSAIFLKERPSALQAVFAAVSVAGAAGMNLFGGDGGGNKPLGALLLTAAVLSAAVFNILSRRESARFSPTERTFFMMGTGALGFTAAAIAVYGKGYFTAAASALTEPVFNISLGYLALVSSVAAYFLYNYATSNISVVRATSFSNVIAVVSVLGGVLLLNESFGAVEAVCSASIIVGVFGVNLAGAERSGKQKECR